MSEKAKGKRSSRLVPAEEEEDDEEEEDSDADMIEIVDEASTDSDDDDDDQSQTQDEREGGITEDDLIGSVSRDPGEEAGLSRRELTPLRRSLAKDRRLPETKRVKETGPAMPREMVRFLEREVAKGKSLEQIVAPLSRTIFSSLKNNSNNNNPSPIASSSKSKPKPSSSKPVNASLSDEEENDPQPKLTPAQLAKREKLRQIERNKILGLHVGDEEAELAVEEDKEEEEDEENDPIALKPTPVKTNSFVMPSGYIYATGGNQRGRKNWTAEEDRCLLDAMKMIYPQSKMWSKIVALHGINGVDSTVLKDRNVQSCKDRARNIKIQMLKARKVAPEYLSGIKIDKETQAILDRRNGIVVDDPAFAPVPRPARVVAEDDGEEEIDEIEEEEDEGQRKKARVSGEGEMEMENEEEED
ncbi:hypothetical protein BDY24DRAFT_387579 [Mrakia frigida]|uniref:Tbf1p n=1 Tax=Mrakia frigida TaxID=29902 RepID=UPI003FCC12A1